MAQLPIPGQLLLLQVQEVVARVRGEEMSHAGKQVLEELPAVFLRRRIPIGLTREDLSELDRLAK